jgi:transposase
MNNNERYTMSSKELARKDILDRVIRRELTQVKAAKLLKVSDRRVRKLLAQYKQHGVISLISKKRGNTSNRAFTPEFKANVLGLIKTKYPDFGPTFAAEKLQELDNIIISKETLRRWLLEAGIRETNTRKKINLHQSRERRECFGELVQIDGSHHDWFEGRAPKCCLIVFIDDATSSLLYCRFEEAETTQGYFRATKDYINTYGKPLSYYSDKHSIFRVNQETAHQGITQFQRAMQELDIQLICAHSPQAKGKVERANKTLQDRLIKEMRLRGINNIEQANKFLPEFIQKYNAKFAKPPKSLQDAHRAITISEQQLNYILSVRESRTLSKNLECSFNNLIYQIITKTTGYRLRFAKVEFAYDTNDNLSLWHNQNKLQFKTKQKELRTPLCDRKTVTNKVYKKPIYKPAPNHPWRAYKKALKVSLHKQELSNGEKLGSF